jgi:Skp family chaperone for outer membrane proteins
MRIQMYKTIRLITVPLLFAMMLCAGSVVVAQTGSKVGIFDAQRVSMETVEGQRLQAQLDGLRSSKQAELKALDDQITLLREQLSQQALSLSAQRRAALELDIQRKTLEFSNANELASQELQLELNNAMSQFNDLLLLTIDQFGREEGFDILFDSSVVAWSSDSLDVTTALIDSVNDRFPAEGD